MKRLTVLAAVFVLAAVLAFDAAIAIDRGPVSRRKTRAAYSLETKPADKEEVKQQALSQDMPKTSPADKAKAKKQAKSSAKWVKSKYGLGALMDLSSDRKKMEGEYKKETENYEKARGALQKNRLEVGSDAATVKKVAGDPVITLYDEEEKEYRWVYKPGTESFFDGNKVYIMFDEDGKVKGWEATEEGH